MNKKEQIKKTNNKTRKIDLQIPKDENLLKAMGRLTAAHANLELVLKMCVKSLAGLSVMEAMVAYDRANTSEVRECVRRLFRQACNNESLRCKLRAMLGEAKVIADDRNRLIHRPWGISKKGDLLTSGENWIWGNDVPSHKELDILTKRINELASGLNHQRLHGFIRDAAKKNGKTETERAS